MSTISQFGPKNPNYKYAGNTRFTEDSPELMGQQNWPTYTASTEDHIKYHRALSSRPEDQYLPESLRQAEAESREAVELLDEHSASTIHEVHHQACQRRSRAVEERNKIHNRAFGTMLLGALQLGVGLALTGTPVGLPLVLTGCATLAGGTGIGIAQSRKVVAEFEEQDLLAKATAPVFCKNDSDEPGYLLFGNTF